MTTTTTNTEPQTGEALVIGRRAVAVAAGSDGSIATVTDTNGHGQDRRYMLAGRWHEAAEIVLLPSLGQPVSITTSMGGLLSGLYLGAHHQASGGYLVSVCDAGTVVRGRVDDIKSLAATTIATGEPATGPHLDALKALAHEVEVFRSSTEAHERFMSELVADAHVWADDNDLCETFDRFMTEHGLEGRERDYEVRVTGTFSVYLTRTAASEEAACEAVDVSDVIEAISREDLIIDSTTA